jgi:hypothetical protein
MKPQAALRLASLGLVAAISVGNLATNARRALPTVEGSPSSTCEVARQAHRFGPVRLALAVGNVKGTIGFIGDVPAEQRGADDQATEDYYIAQYWLAPVVLDSRSEAYEWAVASLRANSPGKRILGGWRVEGTPDDGVFLLEKTAP